MGGNRPGGGDRPSLGNINRPTTLPGNINRPGLNRPGAGGSGEQWRPGDRPIIGGGGNRPNRPGINDNINIGNNVNIGGGNVNIGGGNFVGNRPGWDRPNWNNPGWGWGAAGGGWAGNWHDHCIRPNYGWYNGCWNGHWGSNWYRPLAWGAVGWGLGSWTSGWGYGSSYYNPYYTDTVAAASVPYDYSQPVVVNNYITEDATGAPVEPPAPTAAEEQATQLFDAGLAQFKQGDYKGALSNFDAALQKLPGDPVIHEVRALALFALGDFNSAAAALNSFLSSAPGMDWTTMSSLYGNVDDYQTQLNKLQSFCQSNPNDAAAHFVLAYHALVIDDKDAAIDALKVVVKNQPKDTTAKRMLDALLPARPATPAPASAPASEDAPTTDLVGKWRAKAGTSTINLTFDEGTQFTWQAVQAGKPAIELKGEYTVSSDGLSLDTTDQGSMAGTVQSLGPDKWQFALSGAPPSDPGLTFQRVSN